MQIRHLRGGSAGGVHVHNRWRKTKRKSLEHFCRQGVGIAGALSISVVQSDVDCQESVDSPVIRIHLILAILLVSAIACVFFVPLFCDCTLSSTVSQLLTLPRAQGTTALTVFFFAV